MSKQGDSIRDSYMVYPGCDPLSWGVCHLRVIMKDRRTLLVASEIRLNPGPSVNKAIAGIWAAIQKKYPHGILGPDPLLVEHYDEAVYGEAGMGERLVQVKVQKGKTARRHTTPDEVASLAGCSPDDLSIPVDRLVLKRVRGVRS